MSEREFEAVYRAAELLRCGLANDARDEIDRLIRDCGGDPPPDPQLRRVERERARRAA